MGKIFGHNRYDAIRKEMEAWSDWEEEADIDYEETEELSRMAGFTAADMELPEDTAIEEDLPADDLQFVEEVDDFMEFTEDISEDDMGFTDEEAEELGMELIDLEEVDEEEEPEDDEEGWLAGILSVKTLCIALAVLLVCLAGMIGFNIYKDAKEQEAQLAANYTQIGTGLIDVEVLGGEGLTALREVMASAASESETVESSEYQETDVKATVQVGLVLTSVKKDLKIKFTNKSTGKLIANIPFEVEITSPGGKTSTWVDRDMDGIIYEKDISSGKYTVSLVPLTDEKYNKYLMLATNEKVDVKENIAYEKVDVSAEIKDESEIDVSKEEEEVEQTPVESVNEDTVVWVESTMTYVGDNYKEINKSDIQAPIVTGTNVSGENTLFAPDAPNSIVTLLSKFSPFTMLKLSAAALPSEWTASVLPVSEITTAPDANQSSQTGTEATPTPSGEARPTPSGEATPTPTPTPSGEATPTPSGEATPTPTPSGEATPTPTPTPSGEATPTPTPSGEATPTPTPSGEATPTPTPSGEVTPTPTPSGEVTPTPGVTPTPSITPTPSPTVTPETPLKTKTGADVYVQDGDTYRIAMTSDYNKADVKYYIKESGYKYTGWNTIDGYVYYFDANGKPVTGEQVIRGAVYNFDSNGRLNNGSGVMGIDVSSHNGSIDWNAVANSGVDYVIIRCGYRGYGSGALVEDSKFRYNINGAINAGLKVGVYFFSQALDEIEAVEEASMVLNLVSGYQLTYPIFLDVEYSNSAHNGRADGLDVATRTAVCKAFCQTITNAGYQAGIYANKTWLQSYIDAGALSGYKIWLAQYAKEPTYSGKYDMWQYSCTGSISGIKGDVDLNMSYLGY